MTSTLRLGPLPHRLGSRTLVMGVLNVTPDSFSDGGLHARPDAALAQARRLIAEGADIVDVGGESTRPGSSPISAGEELARVLPVLDGLAALDTVVSIDTYKASVAREAIRRGAHVVNDVWGLQRDPDMARIVAEAEVPVVVMHNREAADETIDILSDIADFFERSLAIAAAAGIARDAIILDPGIGFGKTFAQNLVILRGLDTLRRFGCPLLVGASRKRFIGALTGQPAPERLAGTLAAHVLAASRGADIIRAHDVAAHVEALAVADAICRGKDAAR